MVVVLVTFVFFFFTATSPTEIYTLSLHDAIPIYRRAIEAEFAACLVGDQQRARPRARARQRLPGVRGHRQLGGVDDEDRKSTRLNSSHMSISYAVFCLKKKKTKKMTTNYNTNETR